MEQKSITGASTQQMGKISSKKKRDGGEGERPAAKRAKKTSHGEDTIEESLEYDGKFWGPYLSDRQWGTVREDTEVEGESCWTAVGHDSAQRVVYRWGEDGLMGVADYQGRLCASLALWNGKDPFLKERLFGLSGPEGNHGEDVKEVYYYLDNTPDHTYMRALYRYPMKEFPYERLRNENVDRQITKTEYEILDTGVFDEDQFWDVYTEYAKDVSGSLVCSYTVHNRSTHAASLTIIPQFWFRNTWSWSRDQPVPHLAQTSPFVLDAVYTLGSFVIRLGVDDAESPPRVVFTDNEDATTSPPSKLGGEQHYKDAFHNFVVNGDQDAVMKEGPATKCAAVYRLTVPPGGHKKVCWGIYPKDGCPANNLWDVSNSILDVIQQRSLTAESFYQSLFPVTWDTEWLGVARQACAGLLWHKQYYGYGVRDWLDAVRRRERHESGCCGVLKRRRDRSTIRNNQWTHFNAHDILSVPDKWEFPWFAPWDTAFQMVPLVRLDAEFAKDQLLLLLSDRFLHPSGQMPGCEYDFEDMNPPIQAWSVLKVFRHGGATDTDFLSKAFTGLQKHYQWILTEKCLWNQFIFHAGFLGLDNISAINRSESTPADTDLEQADATGWMAFYSLNMIEIALTLRNVDAATSYLLNFVKIFQAINLDIGCGGLWHHEDNFYYDVLSKKSHRSPIRLRSLVGLVPIAACCIIRRQTAEIERPFYAQLERLGQEHPPHIWKMRDGRFALTLVPHSRLEAVLNYLVDEDEFLSPYGIRSLSKYYSKNPYMFQPGQSPVKYAPGESESVIFGRNSNWRGPIWLSMNYVLVEALQTHHALSEGSLTVRVTSGQKLDLHIIAMEICHRVVALFMPKGGRRPLHGEAQQYSTNPLWKDVILFYEYFHGDTGRGCGASHQTGWTALIVEFFYKILDR